MKLFAACLVAAFVVTACGGQAPPSSPTSSVTAGTTTASPGPAAGTFDCARPANKAQQLVCNETQLSDLDRRAQSAYQRALARPGADQPALTAAQNAFAVTRDGCANQTDIRTCVLEAYQTRLVELAIADPATAAPPVVSYDCPPDAGTLTAQFYNQLDPKTAVLDWKGNRVILFIQPSGSGARYGRQGSEYWEHQGEVTLNLSGTEFVCRTR
nr:MliC family protein [Mycobacterium asiaticum]